MKKILSVVLSVFMMISIVQFYASAYSEVSHNSVEFSMEIPNVGDEIVNPVVTTTAKGVKIQLDLNQIDGTHWYQEPDSNVSIGGVFKRGIYYLKVVCTTYSENETVYSFNKNCKFTLNGTQPASKNIGKNSATLFFPVSIGNGGSPIDKVNLKINPPSIGNSIGKTPAVVQSSFVTVSDPEGGYWTESKNTNTPLTGFFEFGKKYTFKIELRSDVYHYFDTQSRFYINGSICDVEKTFDRDGYSWVIINEEFQPSGYPLLPYVDAQGYVWYSEGIKYCVNNGYMTGVSDNLFRPNSTVTRAMFVTILSKLDEADTSEYLGSSFDDVPEDTWYSKSVEWAFRNGFTTGTGDRMFSPNAGVSREQLAQFLYTYSKNKGYDFDLSASLDKYSDRESISKWAETAMSWAVANGLISGTSETTLSPGKKATRAQIALIIMNYHEMILGPWTVIDNLALSMEIPKAGDTAGPLTINGIDGLCSQSDTVFNWNLPSGESFDGKKFISGETYYCCFELYANERCMFERNDITVTFDGAEIDYFSVGSTETSGVFLNETPDLLSMCIVVRIP